MAQINPKFFIRQADSSRPEVICTNLLAGLTIFGHTYPNDYQEFDKYRDSTLYTSLQYILRTMSQRGMKPIQKADAIKSTLGGLGLTPDQIAERNVVLDGASLRESSESASDGTTVSDAARRARYKSALALLIKFFSEFSFSPSYRFVNSLVISKNPVQYVKNYFRIQDHQYVGPICDKVESPEFTNIMRELNGASPKPINTRFEVYFGDPGAGKTVRACAEATDHRCIVCSSDMLPSDLLQNFCFKDGKADFDPSDLWLAMENGWKIVLDEVNMLPFESLRFLQGITDGKETINFKGHVIKIHPDFKIIATMNLNVDGRCIPLPAPLVDRSYDIVEFKLSADDLINAIM